MTRTLPLVLATLLLTTLPALPRDASDVDLKDSRVNVPWEEFKSIIRSLTEKVTTQPRDTVFAPVEYLISSCSVSGTATGDKSVRLVAQVTVHVLPSRQLHEQGWVAIPLTTGNDEEGSGVSSGGAVLERVLLDGKPATTQGSGGACTLLLPKPGVYALSLDYYCPIANEEGTRRFSIDLPRSASAGIDLVIAGMRADVQINGVPEQAQRTPQGTRVTAALALGEPVEVAWSASAGEQEGREAGPVAPKTFATSGLLVSIKENRVTYQYRVDFEIWHQKLTSFSIGLPDTFPIENVQGAGLADWKVERTDKGPVLTVRTNFAPERDYELTVDFSQKLESAAARVRVPTLRVLNVSREAGYVAVQATETMEVFPADSTTGLSAVGTEELPAWLQSEQEVLMRFKYSRPPWGLQLDVRRHKDMAVLVAIADEALFTTLLTEDGYVLAKVRYFVRNNQKQYLRLSMPKGWTLWSALIDGSAVMPASSDSASVVLIPLRKMSETGEGNGFTLELVYFSEAPTMGWMGRFRFEAPIIDINCQQVNGEVWAPQRFRYSGFKGSLEKVDTYEQRYLASTTEVSDDRAHNRPAMPVQSNTIALTKQGRSLALPVEIAVPQVGTRLQFSKKLTIAGEKADLRFGFRRKLDTVTGAGALLFWVLSLLTGILCLGPALQRPRPKNAWVYPLLGLGVWMILFVLSAILNTHASGLFAAFVLGLLSRLVGRLAFASKPKAASAAALTALLVASALTLPATASGQNAQPALGNTTVSLPWSDFRQILKDMKRDTLRDTARSQPPADVVVSEAVITGQPSGERQCVFSAAVDFSVLAEDKWVEVPLGSGLAVLPGATVDGKPAPLGVNDDGQTMLALRGKGAHRLAYRFSAALQLSSGSFSCEAHLPGQTAGTIRMLLDRPGLAVSANGRPLAPKGTESGRFVYEGGLGSDEQVSLSWQQEVSQISGQAAMVLGQLNTLYSIGTGIVQVRAQVNLSIFHQEIRQFALSVPPDLDIIDLTGPAVATWESRDSGGSRVVSVFLKYSLRESAPFELTAEMNCADSLRTLTMPVVTLVNVARQEGTVGVGVLGNVELTPTDNSANVLRKDKRELPGWFAGKGDVLYVYQYLSAGYRIEVGLKPHGNVEVLSALASNASLQSVIRDDGKMITQLDLTVRNRGEQFLRVAWKPQWQLWSLYCNGQPARPAEDTVTGELLIPLKKLADQTAETQVKLVYLSRYGGFWWLGGQRIAYPSVNVPVENISGSLYIPENVGPFMRLGNLRRGELATAGKWFAWWAVGGLFRPGEVRMRALKGHAANGIVEMRESIMPLPPPPPPPPRDMALKAAQTEEKRKERAKSDEDENDELQMAGAKPVVQGFAARTLRKSALGMLAGMGGGGGQSDDFAAQRSSLDAGQLSIPVDIVFEGKPEPFANVMLKAAKQPVFFFLYRKAPASMPWLIGLLLQALVLAAAWTLTSCLWTGWTRTKVVNGMLWPLLCALLIARLIDKPLYLDLLVVLPAIWFCVYAARTLARWLREQGLSAGRKATTALAARLARAKAPRPKSPASTPEQKQG